jgi:hypothetical protein
MFICGNTNTAIPVFRGGFFMQHSGRQAAHKPGGNKRGADKYQRLMRIPLFPMKTICY